MTIHKNITAGLCLGFALAIVPVTILLATIPAISKANAQMQQPSSRPPKAPSYYSAPYWEGFKLKQEGKCDEALEKLLPIARQGHGFEDAQLATGLCMLRVAGLKISTTPETPPQNIMDDVTFKKGFNWILKAANAGNFQAQASLVSLYADNLVPEANMRNSNVIGAMWAHLYLTNPLRLQIGAPLIEEKQLKNLENKMTKNQWLSGKELARNWIPVYK